MTQVTDFPGHYLFIKHDIVQYRQEKEEKQSFKKSKEMKEMKETKRGSGRPL